MAPDDLDARLSRAAPRGRPPALVAVTGVRVRGGDAPARVDDRWHIGSCRRRSPRRPTPASSRGAAAWGSPPAHLLTALAPGMDPGRGAVTIDDPLRHHAGLPGDLAPALLAAARSDPRPRVEQRAEVAARALARRAAPAPSPTPTSGTSSRGAVIEEVTGRPWEDALRDEVLDPLSVRSAGVGAPADGPGGHAAPGRPRPGASRRARGARRRQPGVMAPAGGPHTDLADGARFVARFLEGCDGAGYDAVALLLAPPRGARGRDGVGAPARPLVATDDGRARLRARTPRLAADVLSAA